MSKQKRIVFLLGGFPYASETFITNHIVETIESGYDVNIYANHLNTIDDSSQRELIEKYELLDKVTIRDIKTPASLFAKIIKSLSLLIKNLRYISLFLRIIKSDKPNKHRLWYESIAFKVLDSADIYHSHFADQSLFLSDLIEVGFFKKEFKLFVTFHGYDAHLKKNTKLVVRKKYERLLNHAHIVFVNSNYLKSKVLELGCRPQKIKIVPIGVDINFFAKKIRKQFTPFTILTVGRLIKLKGQEYGIRVVSELVSKGYDVKYLIVGYGKEKKNLQKQIDDLQLNNFVELLGKKTQVEILKYLYKSNLFLMTSVKDESNRSEAFGLVSVEAQSTGIPVVAFDSGGVSSTFKDGYSGYLIEEKNIEMMALKVAYLIENKDVLLEMGDNANIFVRENFNSKRVIERHVTLYNS